jgi:predicted nucleic acid-binding protein
LSGTLFDTSLYVTALRRGGDVDTFLRRLIPNVNLWLSAVVLEELYAGTDERSKAWVKQLEAEFNRDDRILVPNLEDWIKAGETLNRLAGRYGYEQIGRGRLTNNALIAMNAARMGIRVVTSNAKGFSTTGRIPPIPMAGVDDLIDDLIEGILPAVERCREPRMLS